MSAIGLKPGNDVVFNGVEQAGKVVWGIQIPVIMHKGAFGPKEVRTNVGYYCPNEHFFLPVEYDQSLIGPPLSPVVTNPVTGPFW